MPSKSEQLRIVVSGLIAQHPRLGGVAWDYLQYPVGLTRLGHEVYYIEDSGEWPYLDEAGPEGDWVARDFRANVEHLDAVLSRFGLGDRWAYRYPVRGSAAWFGISDARREEIVRSADLLINVSGTLEHPESYRGAATMVYVDSDPVFTQARIHLDALFRARVDAHDLHFTFGELLEFGVPDTGHQWRATRQPILLDAWQTEVPAPRDVFTTVMSWTSYEPLELASLVLGQKDVELWRFIDLPSRLSRRNLEIALPSIHHVDWESGDADIDVEAQAPWELLSNHGWLVADAASACSTLDDYRSYIHSSSGEWSVAKNGYVQGRPGWFSCRSACYLAAGRPVVAQDTGFSDVIPTGEGVLAFSTPDEAVEAISRVEARYQLHSKAARAIAEEFFESDRVLGKLVDEAMG